MTSVHQFVTGAGTCPPRIYHGCRHTELMADSEVVALSRVGKAARESAVSQEVLPMRNASEVSKSTAERGEQGEVHGGSYHRVLIPVGSPGSWGDALATAARERHVAYGQARLVHVRMWEEHGRSAGKYFEETSEQATEALDAAVTDARALGLRVSGIVVEAYRPLVAKRILSEVATWGADAIVLTVPTHKSRWGVLSGSVSARINRKAECPVLWASSADVQSRSDTDAPSIDQYRHSGTNDVAERHVVHAGV